MTKIAFDPPDGVDGSELQEKVIQVLESFVRERPPLLFGTCDRLTGRLERATVDASSVVAALRDRRAAIFAVSRRRRRTRSSLTPTRLSYLAFCS